LPLPVVSTAALAHHNTGLHRHPGLAAALAVAGDRVLVSTPRTPQMQDDGDAMEDGEVAAPEPGTVAILFGVGLVQGVIGAMMLVILG